MSLPHNELCDTRAISDWIESFLADPDRREIFLAVSKDFWEPKDQELYPSVYPEYRRHFFALVDNLTRVLGEPRWRGGYDDTLYPSWAVGEQIAVWERENGSLYLRLHHEDREVPILIALAWASA
jgi:hypothetical protein